MHEPVQCRGTGRIVILATNQYTIKEDMSPSPDGDGDCDTGDTTVLQKDLDAAIRLHGMDQQ